MLLLIFCGGAITCFARGVAKCEYTDLYRKSKRWGTVPPPASLYDDDPTERFRVILGYFTLEQTDRIEGIFEAILERPSNGPQSTNYGGRTYSCGRSGMDGLWQATPLPPSLSSAQVPPSRTHLSTPHLLPKDSGCRRGLDPAIGVIVWPLESLLD